MNKKSVNRIAISATMGAVATLALATPASAEHVTDPPAGSAGSATTATQNPTITPSPSSGTEWQALPVATGALGGLALAGAGVAAAAGVRRRRSHVAL